jgi:hypothetical protein
MVIIDFLQIGRLEESCHSLITEQLWLVNMADHAW